MTLLAVRPRGRETAGTRRPGTTGRQPTTISPSVFAFCGYRSECRLRGHVRPFRRSWQWWHGGETRGGSNAPVNPTVGSTERPNDLSIDSTIDLPNDGSGDVPADGAGAVNPGLQGVTFRGGSLGGTRAQAAPALRRRQRGSPLRSGGLPNAAADPRDAGGRRRRRKLHVRSARPRDVLRNGASRVGAGSRGLGPHGRDPLRLEEGRRAALHRRRGSRPRAGEPDQAMTSTSAAGWIASFAGMH